MKLNFDDGGWELFQEMVGYGLKPNVVIFNMMINWYWRNSDMDFALVLLDTVKGYGLTPNLYCYTAMMIVFCKAKRLVEIAK